MITALLAQTGPTAPDYIPPMDDFGIPAPAWVFQGLLMLTMFLHVVFMNFTLGGSIVAVVLDGLTLAGRGRHDHTVRLIWQVLPVALSLTITTGVAPLLFVQVLFGHYFYVANVFMGFVWFAVIPVLILGFYAAYALSYRLGNAISARVGRWDHLPGRRLAVSLFCAACFGLIAWVLTNNHMLTVQPEAWPLDGQWKQNRLAVTPLTTVPRYLHNLGGALAVTGVWLAAIGWWRRARGVGPQEENQRLVLTGLRITFAMVIAAAVFGPVFLLTIPAEVRAGLLRPNLFALLWWIALAGVAAQLGLGWMALREPRNVAWFAGLLATMCVTLVGMLAAREQVRLGFLGRPEGGGFAVEDWVVRPQVSSLILFLVMLVVALAVTIWLAWISAAAPRTPAQSKLGVVGPAVAPSE